MKSNIRNVTNASIIQLKINTHHKTIYFPTYYTHCNIFLVIIINYWLSTQQYVTAKDRFPQAPNISQWSLTSWRMPVPQDQHQ